MPFAEMVVVIGGGLKTTALVTLYALLYAIPFAFVFGTLQHILRGRIYALVTAVIEFWRNSPVIILMFVFYYTLPAAQINLSSITVSALVLGLNTGAYGSQAVRAGLQIIDRGQSEAGLALGLSRLETLILIELPQGLVLMIPNMINLLAQLIKATSLVSLLALADITYKAKELNQFLFDPVPIYSALILMYIAICYPIMIIGRLCDRKISAKGKRGHA